MPTTVGADGTAIGYVDKYYAPSQVHAPDALDTLQHYYRKLAKQCSLTTLTDIVGDDVSQLPARVDQVYVAPDVWQYLPEGKKGGKGLDARMPAERERAPLASYFDPTHPGRRIVLLANAGMGKTTAVNIEVLRLASQSNQPWLMLRLPALAKQLSLGTAPCDAIAVALAVDIHGALGKGGVTAEQSVVIAGDLLGRFDNQAGVLLLDAFDEVPELLRPAVANAVRQFLALQDKHGLHRVVVTSRPYAYNAEFNGFERVELAEFSVEQTTELVARYFEQVEEKPQLAQALQRALDASEAHSPLRMLMREPMLATYVCRLVAARAPSVADPIHAIPVSRGDLLEGIVGLLLETWDPARKNTEVEAFGEMFRRSEGAPSPLRKVLERAALHRRDTIVGDGKKSFVPVGVSREQLHTWLDDEMPDNLPVRARSVAAWLARRSGLMRPSNAGESRFECHAQLEDFLAVSAVRRTHPDTTLFAIEVAKRMLGAPNWYRLFVEFAMESLRARDDAMERLTVYLLDGLADNLPREPNQVMDAPGALALLASVWGASADGSSHHVTAWVDRLRNAWLELFNDQSNHLFAQQRADIGDALGRRSDPRFVMQTPWVWAKRHGSNTSTQEPIPGFVRVPKGEFTMGRKDEADNKPRTITIADDFYVARTHTTVAQYAKFVESGAYRDGAPAIWGAQGGDWLTGKFDSKIEDKALSDWLKTRPKERRNEPWEWAAQARYGNRPVTGVCWFEARAYARWLNGQLHPALNDAGLTHYRASLPTEPQWERAARARADGTQETGRWPWGDSETDAAQQANIRGSGIEHVSPVGAFAPNGIGLYDMAGNAWQWMDNLYQPDKSERFDAVPRDAELKTVAKWQDSDLPALRGGSWIYLPELAACSYRLRNFPDFWLVNIGFRVALSLAKSEA